MRRSLPILAVVVGLLSMPAAATSQTAAADAVAGTVTFPSRQPAGTTQETYLASSGPSGESAGGSVQVALIDFGVFLDFEVTCLWVSGNRGVIGMHYFDRVIGEMSLYRLVVDGGPGGTDGFGELGAAGIPTDCATVSINVNPALSPVSGDAIVTDAQPFPTSKDQCSNGGWRNFPGFKNQGQCVSFVATGGKHHR